MTGMLENYRFEIPKHQKSIIKVIGVGGGGSNAVNHMFNSGIKDVEFIVCNTDSQALKSTPVPHKLQIGVGLTEGLGAGANPEIGMNAALESKEEVRDMLSEDTKMLFITAGMGGGTGTGAAPVIAKIASELGILTVGIVTAPFSFEGKRKMQAAQKGIDELKSSCDTVLVILNDKLREIYGNLSIRDAFAQADNVLNTAAKSIAEIITVTSEVNVDFQDVRTVMRQSGPAVMGSAEVSGENRARRAAESALSSPLLNNKEIKGAQKILLSITYGEEAELTMDELTEITDYIEEEAGLGADVIFGQGMDPSLGENLRVTVIATGFEEKDEDLDKRRVYDLETNKPIEEKEEKAQKKDEPSRHDVDTYHKEEEKTQQSTEQHYNEDDHDDQQEKKVFTLDSKYEIKESKPNDDLPLFNQPQQQSSPQQEPEYNELEQRRMQFIKQSQERIRRIGELNTSGDMDEFRKQLEVPAYQRRNVRLKDVPHSSDQEVSRYKLNDDNDILGNNRFLHDNVD